MGFIVIPAEDVKPGDRVALTVRGMFGGTFTHYAHVERVCGRRSPTISVHTDYCAQPVHYDAKEVIGVERP